MTPKNNVILYLRAVTKPLFTPHSFNDASNRQTSICSWCDLGFAAGGAFMLSRPSDFNMFAGKLDDCAHISLKLSHHGSRINFVITRKAFWLGLNKINNKIILLHSNVIAQLLGRQIYVLEQIAPCYWLHKKGIFLFIRAQKPFLSETISKALGINS